MSASGKPAKKSATIDMPPPPAGEPIAAILRRLRRSAGLTLQELADRCSLASSTLSKIENGQMSPTYDTILRVAQGLRIDVADLFTGAASHDVGGRRTVTRAGQGIVRSTEQYSYEMLAAELSGKQFIPLLTTVTAGTLSDFPSLVRHNGEEFFYVLSGQVVLHTEHYAPTVLNAGDSCYFDSTMGHALVSASEASAQILWICSRVGAPLTETGLA
ncbi:XRE family transcriptional regulator [Rhizobium rhizosphaerae]|uniref:XRE family transcriptional regulator n=2 Tax=Xaviernesmea rhizosphaerae TaxID=1672749 RepID=A0A1Q9AHW5_9HYPH|nr:XRE family transcriptional regulator [Xaviernesmea rhizosphaerae]OLP54801.1 XRE family transcriptional regulator [Xaviernesmea rhizosphaerae]